MRPGSQFSGATPDSTIQEMAPGSQAPGRFSVPVGALVAALGLVVLSGWELGIRGLISVRPDWPAMTPATAAEFIFCGCSLVCLTLPASHHALRLRASRVLAAAVMLIALWRLCASAFHWPIGFELLGLREPAGDLRVGAAHMAPATSLDFVLLGCALLMAGSTRLSGLFQTVTLSAALIGWMGLFDYLFGGTQFPAFVKLSLPSAIGLVLLAAGVFCARTDAGLLQLLRSNSAGGILARRLLPPAILLPFIASVLRVKAGRPQGLGTESEAALFAVTIAAVLAALVWLTARLLHRSDLTRYAAETLMHQNMTRLKAIIATDPECVKILDPEGRLLEMNPAGLSMLELDSLAEAQAVPLAHFILPPYRQAFAALHRTVMEGGSGVLEFEIQGRRGTHRWLETHAVPLRDKLAHVISVLGITRDISARKRADRTQEQVRLFRELLDRTNDLIYVADARTGRILDCNATLPGRLGYSASEVRQLSLWDLSTAAGAPTDWDERVERVRASGSLFIASDYRRKDGSTFPVEISLSYVASDPFPLLIAVTRDITQRKQQEDRVAHFTRLLKMQSAVHSAVLRIREPDALLDEVCRLATQIGGYDHAITTLVDPDDKTLRPKYRAGIGGLPVPDVLPEDNDTGPQLSITSRALRTGEVTVCADLRHSEPTLIARDEALRMGVRSVAALPLTVEGARIGVMTLMSGRSEQISEEELMLLQDVAATVSLGLRSQQHADTAQFLTYYDSASGLAKRALFCERLNALIATGLTPVTRPVVVAFDVCDLSGFNDTYGRTFGDALVRAVAEKARTAVENEFHLGHLGGGTFVLVARSGTSAVEGTAALMDDAIFAQPLQIQGRSVRVSCRSGLAKYPDDGMDAATLIQKAEAALRQAKECGERYLHFQIQMQSDVTKRLQLEHDLREAVDLDQFVLHYQPQINIATGRIDAVEALLRWRHPQEGLALPGRFLSVLETSGLIVRVGAWVLSQASADCRALRGLGLGPLRIAVNVSALQIRRREFVEDVLNSVGSWEGDYGIDIEITESSILQDLEDTRRKLQRLRSAGIRIAIDDFGTGYSSLGLLSRLPIDILKIDRTFISGLPGDRASVSLTSSIIQIASGLGLVTVAEGVETAAQLATLRTFNCTQSQGWLHCKPVPIAELVLLLRRQAAQTVVGT